MVWRDLTKRQATSRPDHQWPEIWKSMSRNSKIMEKNWASERPKLENARNLRGVYFIDPEDTEFANIIKNECTEEIGSTDRSCCPLYGNGVTCVQKDIHKSRLTCMLEADESTRLSMEGIEPRIHEDHIAGKGDYSLHHDNLVQSFSYASSDENTGSERSSGQGMVKN